MAAELQFEKKPRAWLNIVDSLVMIKRSSTHILRNTDQLLGTFFQPIMFLVLFSAVYSGAVSTLDNVSYTDFLMAGLIVQTLAFGSTTTALAVANDLQKGIIDRFRSLPMSNLAVLNGHVVSDVFRNILSTIVLIIAGFVIGFRPNADGLDWILLVGLTVLLTLAFSWLSAILGVVAKSVEGVQWLSFIFVFPLTFASSAFVNPELMTSWLRPFAENQPITHIVDTYRSLLIGTPMGDSGWIATIWLVAIIVLSMPIASWLFKRKTTQ
ncbi:MAG: transporter permease [Candidatus Saccharibacteria bacterium]|nr:transporter permease [Candidatus Saccharibacteria bacterium]